MSLFSQLKEDIAVVFDRDPAARSTFEVVTTYPGFHAMVIHRLAHKLWRLQWKWLARFTSVRPSAAAYSSTMAWGWWWGRPPRSATTAPCITA
jgi:serine acetyltransferase